MYLSPELEQQQCHDVLRYYAGQGPGHAGGWCSPPVAPSAPPPGHWRSGMGHLPRPDSCWCLRCLWGTHSRPGQLCPPQPDNKKNCLITAEFELNIRITLLEWQLWPIKIQCTWWNVMVRHDIYIKRQRSIFPWFKLTLVLTDRTYRRIPIILNLFILRPLESVGLHLD